VQKAAKALLRTIIKLRPGQPDLAANSLNLAQELLSQESTYKAALDIASVVGDTRPDRADLVHQIQIIANDAILKDFEVLSSDESAAIIRKALNIAGVIADRKRGVSAPTVSLG
jgi:hypothetical protein